MKLKKPKVNIFRGNVKNFIAGESTMCVIDIKNARNKYAPRVFKSNPRTIESTINNIPKYVKILKTISFIEEIIP